MNALSYKIVIVLLFFVSCTATKKTVVPDTQTLDNIRRHVQYLADDKLEGRRTGTAGEKLAMEYISSEFRQIGLEPKGSNGYYQAFSVNDGKQINKATSFIINADTLETGKDFFPFPYSANQTIEALPSIGIQESDMPWFIDLKEVLEDNKSNPHFDLEENIRTSSKKARQRGASAIILYNTSDIEDKLAFDPKDRTESIGIPVFYVNRTFADKYFSDKSATVNLKMRTDVGEKKRTGNNVVGYIDNGAERTIVLGAHFDHLGYGEDGNSMVRSGPMSIHNGADDNASGTAAVIELARILKKSNARNHNYLFIAFSGEELGLYGSKYFTENPTVNLESVNYMINMDMVGRLNDSSRTVTVGGYGTSPEWGRLIQANSEKDPFKIKIDSSGTGPSDHTSFYRKDIPVLFFFTGLHSDYHRPSDDFDKLNYQGELDIVNYIYSIITSTDRANEKLVFTKTREAQTTTSARFSVSLGIMPDYTFSGTGVRADGVSEGKPAQKAGLKTGDVILQLGEHSTSSLEQYMQALSKFKKGDKVVVKFKRGNEMMDSTVEF